MSRDKSIRGSYHTEALKPQRDLKHQSHHPFHRPSLAVRIFGGFVVAAGDFRSQVTVGSSSTENLADRGRQSLQLGFLLIRQSVDFSDGTCNVIVDICGLFAVLFCFHECLYTTWV